MKFLKVKEWGKYQHYKNRNPPWIKLHLELLTSFTWMALDDTGRLLAIVVMMLAARTGNKIPLDRDFIQRSAYLKKRPDVRPLIDCGFCEVYEEPEVDIENTPLSEVASTMLATNENVLADSEKCLPRERERDRDRDREETEKEKAYARPTLAEVVSYCQERQNRVDPQKWLDYYSSNGFRVGRNPMKDWRAAVRTWERNGFGGPFSESKPNKAEQRQIENLAVNERVKQRIRERVGVLEQ